MQRRPEIVLVRHGETEWSRDGRHTGRTDIPLTDAGRRQAQALGPALAGWEFELVLSSPLSRALETCRLAGLGERAQLRDELLEWDYGEYEGITTPEIRERRLDWVLWRDGCPGGEIAAEVAARVDPLVAELHALGGDAVLFAHGHVLRVLAARWIELAPGAGRGAEALHRHALGARLGARVAGADALERVGRLDARALRLRRRRRGRLLLVREARQRLGPLLARVAPSPERVRLGQADRADQPHQGDADACQPRQQLALGEADDRERQRQQLQRDREQRGVPAVEALVADARRARAPRGRGRSRTTDPAARRPAAAPPRSPRRSTGAPSGTSRRPAG